MNIKYTSPEAKIEDKPRQLTQNEIDYIVEVIPLANRLFPEIGKKIREGFQERLRYLLGKAYLSHGGLAPGTKYGRGVQMMRNEVIRQYRDSQIMPGESVGILAAGAFGEIMTQSTLNTFHSIGKNSNTTTGIRGFKELINVTKYRSNPSSTIHFTNKKLDLRGILKLKDEIIYTTVMSLMVDYSPENFKTLFSDGLPYWYSLYLHLYGENHLKRKVSNVVNNSDWFLRIRLDTAAMYSKGITMEELRQEIEGKKMVKDHSPPSVFCVPSPFNLGIIDIYPVNENIPAPQSQMSIEDRNLSFVSISVKNNLDKIALRGIKGIVGLEPTYYSLILIIEDEEYVGNEVISEENDKMIVRKKWKLTLSQQVFKLLGLDYSHIERLVEAVGADVIKVGEIEGATQSMWILMPESEESKPSDKITEIGRNLKGNQDRVILSNLVKSITEQSFGEGWDDKWIITVNLDILEQTGTNMGQVFSLWSKLKFRSEIILTGSNLIKLSLLITPTISPKALIGKSVNDDRINAETSREKGNPRPPSEIMKASRYYYAFTVDSDITTLTQNNLSDLLQKDFIDPRYTYSNNVRFNLKEFGIEASRNFLIKEFLDVISADGSSVNIQHILLIVDYMTRVGSITKISMTMVNKSVGTLGKITVANAMKELLTSAAFGVRDKISGVSASIMVGKLARIGTAYGELTQSDTVYGEYAEYERALVKVRDQLKYGNFTVQPSQFNQSVEEMISYDLGLETTPADQSPNLPFLPAIQYKLEETTVIDEKSYEEILHVGQESPKEFLTETPISQNLPLPNVYPTHLQNVITSMTEEPCAPSREEFSQIRPDIPSTARTTSLALPEGSTEPNIIFDLPTPSQDIRLGLPTTLAESIEAAGTIVFS